MTPGTRRAAAVAVALLAHALALLGLSALGPAVPGGVALYLDWRGSGAVGGEAARGEWPEPVDEPTVVPVVFLDASALPRGAPVVPVPGAAERAALAATHPAPNAVVDTAGNRAARAGGTQTPGAYAVTGRRDREDKRASIWSDERRYQLARERTANRRTSDEAMARTRDRDYGDRFRQRRARARPGQDEPAFPEAAGTDVGAASLDPTAAADPDDALAAREPEPTRVSGVLVAQTQSPLVALGPPAVDSAQDGPTRDDTDAIGSSDERNPAPFDLTRPAAGGRERGVSTPGQRTGDGGAVRRRAPGDAAARAPLEPGPDAYAVQAWRTDPYFRTLYARVDERVEYPRALALALEQGEVVVRFTLHADGSIGRLRVEKSSGYDEFDGQVVRAVAGAAPFGPVPQAILGDHRAVEVRAPYAFRNPWIR